MRALVIDRPGEARIINIERPADSNDPLHATMRIRRIGLCGTDLSTFLGKNPLVTYPRIRGHEVAATLERVPANNLGLTEGMDVTMSPYSSCGECTACKQGRANACRDNQTLGVQRDPEALSVFTKIALDEKADEIAGLILAFMAKHS